MDDAPVLSHLLKSNDLLPPPAKTAEDCIVGPNEEERNGGDGDSKPYWACRNTTDGDTAASADKKRKRTDFTDKNNNDNSTFEKAVGTFLSSGCCLIPNVLPTEFVAQCKKKATSDLAFLRSERSERLREAVQSNQQHLLAAVQRGDFRELVDRDGGRCDVRFQLDRFPFTAPGLVYNPIVFPLVKELLGGGDVNLLYAGVMWASPQEYDSAAPQKWHGDGGHLFHHAHLPPHCINVFYPLVDLSFKNGTTEFKSGTHRLEASSSSSSALVEPPPEFGFSCDAGGAILFDYRLKHRGGANTSSEPRPVLYLAYAKPFFRDAGNLRSGQSLVVKASSPPWVARILTGEPVAMGKGFEDDDAAGIMTQTNDSTNNNSEKPIPPHCAETPTASNGSGERWVLFRMNVDISNDDEGGEPETLVIYHGDVAAEVSAQFCRSNKLDNQFVSVLADAIQQQIDAYYQSQQQETTS